ncbi:MAG: pyridoxal-phosphate dependent enzyme [Planctomycetes bacterium]|nr:pyridoxal-phosphate dependent enzyme [Planctomycetota bacterium]
MSTDLPEPLLFERFPILRGVMPFRRLGNPNTPVERLRGVGAETGRDVWIKRDDLYGNPGGGKVRKLEFSLAAALSRGKKSLITFGPLGSNHVAATAVHARRLGISTLGILVTQPVQHYVRDNLARSCGSAQIRFTRWSATVPILAMRMWLRERRITGASPAILGPGGTSIAGMLGYVEAALEIARDVRLDRFPKPDYIFVPAGTCGALAGLTAGLRIANLDVTPVGVRVCSRLSCNARTTAWLANRVLGYLRDCGAEFRSQRIRARDVVMLHGFCGKGYGHATEAGTEAMRLALESDGVRLDATYTGKALAGLIEFMSAERHERARALLVNTWAPPIAECPDAGEKQIPAHIHAWLSSREAAKGLL